jgi:hypothetical protein
LRSEFNNGNSKIAFPSSVSMHPSMGLLHHARQDSCIDISSLHFIAGTLGVRECAFNSSILVVPLQLDIPHTVLLTVRTRVWRELRKIIKKERENERRRERERKTKEREREGARDRETLKRERGESHPPLMLWQPKNEPVFWLHTNSKEPTHCSVMHPLMSLPFTPSAEKGFVAMKDPKQTTFDKMEQAWIKVFKRIG